MIILFIATITVLLLVIIYLFIYNKKIKVRHANNIQKLQSIIISSNDIQKQLSEKVIISKEYGNNFRKDMKALGIEMVELQILFVELIKVEKNK